jgi:hypothetical protein
MSGHATPRFSDPTEHAGTIPFDSDPPGLRQKGPRIKNLLMDAQHFPEIGEPIKVEALFFHVPIQMGGQVENQMFWVQGANRQPFPI